MSSLLRRRALILSTILCVVGTSSTWAFVFPKPSFSSSSPLSTTTTTRTTVLPFPLSSSSSTTNTRGTTRTRTHSLIVLLAKKKVDYDKLAALEALEALDGAAEPAVLSIKEQMELDKKNKKAQDKETAKNNFKKSQEKETRGAMGAQGDTTDQVVAPAAAPAANGKADANGKKEDATKQGGDVKSKKELKLLKALELDALEAALSVSTSSTGSSKDDQPKFSKKELKENKKKLEKEAAKAAAKDEKKKKKKMEDEEQKNEEENDEAQDGVASSLDDVNGGGEEEDDFTSNSFNDDGTEKQPGRLTLEDKIRKDRPPPRIRVMESSQPGYTSLRLENVGITFRNQQVLKDVTWGVQTGDRIGLVGANGAGKTTQLRIMSNELEPTTGDVVKSSQDLRVAILRQEFVDELIKERTLKKEFMSVFDQETQILLDLRQAEADLEQMTDADVDAMQVILDRMQELQAQADNKGVYALEAKVKKVMDLMGFTDDEGEDLVASFSGGWKMRIGLGKVLLKDPNILLLGTYIISHHLVVSSIVGLCRIEHASSSCAH
jgi:ABC-type Mn2+/Zn2+ transport system ATPase subunit